MTDFKQELNQKQLQAVTYTGKPLLVLAGAGSGKTRVLTYRAYWLVHEKMIDPKKIVLLTFTNKAAKEMASRVKINLGFAGTFHGFCVRLLRVHGQAININSNFVIYDTNDQKQIMKRVLTNLGEENTAQKIRMYLAIISKYKHNLINIREARLEVKQAYQRTAIQIWQEYQKLLSTSNALDFDDLLTSCVKLLKINDIRDKVNKQFEWILIDEYQDTNKAQFELTKLLLSKPEQLTIVGDASQAIYSFRGADFRNLQLLNKYFTDLKIIELVENYRSTQNILDVAHGIITHNTGHPVLKLKTNKEMGEKIELFIGRDGKSEAQFVVDQCAKILNQGSTVAILYRTNAQSRIFEEELIRSGINYRLVGGVRFYERKEIKDILAYLKVIANKQDIVALERIQKLGKRRQANFQNWLENQNTDQLSPVQLIKHILEITNYLDKYNNKKEDDISRLENIDELMVVANEFTKLEAFLENVALIQAEDLADQFKPENEGVTLMTIHSAKGLEFDNVFVVGLEEGLLPHSRSLLEQDGLEEERRLLYVAITRARYKLFLSFVKTRYLYGGKNNQTPSRFLAEIPQHLLTKHYQTELNKRNMTGRRIVQDWEIEKASQHDFDEIDSW